MPDVFISYAKPDKLVAEALAADLKKRGLNVWWDANLYASQDYHNTILEALDACKVAIVIWSANSVKSEWVRDEASRAHQNRKLLPTFIPPFNLSNIPLGMGQLQAVDVTDRRQIGVSLDRLLPAATTAAPPVVTQQELAARIHVGAHDGLAFYRERDEDKSLDADELIAKYSGPEFERAAVNFLPYLEETSTRTLNNLAEKLSLARLATCRVFTIPVLGRIRKLADGQLLLLTQLEPSQIRKEHAERHHKSLAAHDAIRKIASDALVSLKP